MSVLFRGWRPTGSSICNSIWQLPRTRRTTREQRQYRQFCALVRREPLPDAHTLAQFVIGRAVKGYALSTIEQGVYAVARWGADLGREQLANDPEVRRALKVAAKLAVPKGMQKPLDRRDLRRVVYHLAEGGSDDFVGVRDRALPPGLGRHV